MEGTKRRAANSLGMFDLLKGVGMLTIVFAHTGELYPMGDASHINPLTFCMFAYRESLMAAFYIASGYGFRKRSIGKCIDQQFKTLLKPYIYTGIATTVFHFIIHYSLFGSLHNATYETYKVLGGFALLTTHPFHSGDYVDIGGQSGTVTQIDMSYTRLVTVDNKVVCIPNSTVLASEVVNYSANDTRRAEIQVSAGYDAPTQKVIDALVLAATVDNALLEPAPFAAVVSYGDNAINYTLRFWAKTEDYWDVYFKVNQRIKDIFDEQGIPMTYPHLNVHFDKEFLESRKH